MTPIRRRALKSRGLTLIELLVVAGVIVIISSVILANNNKFGGKVLLQNLVYDIALSMRQAQQYGISVQRFQGQFKSGYGMHFTLADKIHYNIFADAVSSLNGHYDTGEEVDPYAIGRGFYISKLCLTPNGGSESCGYNNLDILFIRPEPDACINGCVGSLCTPASSVTITTDSTGSIREKCSVTNVRARIEVTSPRGDVMSATVQNNGQINVQSN